MTPLVLKLGGELLESPAQRAQVAAVAAVVASTRPLVVIHGGGRAIDVELARRGIAPKKVDGLRVTDAPTLDVVVAVLGGSSNTDLVAALVGRGVRAVGLTGVDAGFGRATPVASHQATSGATIDLGLVGDPTAVDPALLVTLLDRGYVPVVASLGVSLQDDRSVPAQILNVNADVMACRIAAALPGCDLVIAGGTDGVLDRAGVSIATLDPDAIAALIADGTATLGMVAKLHACMAALSSGVRSVRIINGRNLGATTGLEDASGTTFAVRRGGLQPA
jgi:acetylglutamate kinase